MLYQLNTHTKLRHLTGNETGELQHFCSPYPALAWGGRVNSEHLPIHTSIPEPTQPLIIQWLRWMQDMEESLQAQGGAVGGGLQPVVHQGE